MLTNKIKKLSNQYFDEMTKLRHTFHMYPELAFQEHKTTEIIVETLHKLGLEPQILKGGVVAVIEGKYPNKTLLLRADIDALPINEEVDVPYKSRIKGCMHACGHDGHTAILLGTAMILMELREQLHGNVKLMFEAGEENGGGSRFLIREGVLDKPRVDAAVGFHLWGSVPRGNVQVREGAFMAAADRFKFNILGKGGHAAMPHRCIDPIIIAVEILNDMQTIISRRVDPVKPVVISCGTIHGGAVFNAIPDEVEVTGSVRTFDKEIRSWIQKAMEGIINSHCILHGSRYKFEWLADFPAVVNTDHITQLIHRSAEKILGRDRVSIAKHPLLVSESFAFISEAVPSSYFLIGIAPGDAKEVVHHSPKFQWDDEEMLIGTKVLAQLTFDFFNQEENPTTMNVEFYGSNDEPPYSTL